MKLACGGRQWKWATTAGEAGFEEYPANTPLSVIYPGRLNYLIDYISSKLSCILITYRPNWSVG